MGSGDTGAIDCSGNPAEIRCYWGDVARLLELRGCVDQRGRLVEFDFSALDFSAMPFEPCRSFVIRDVPVDMVWAQQRYSGPEAALGVMAGHPYDPDAYLVEAP